MKKTIALPLIAVLALGAAACSKKAEDNTANTEASADMNAAATDELADINAATDNASDNAALGRRQCRRLQLGRSQSVERDVIVPGRAFVRPDRHAKRPRHLSMEVPWPFS